MRFLSTRALLLPLSALLLAACDAQVEPDYPGEPLATVHGTVVKADDSALGDIDAALVWVNLATNPDTLIGARTDVEGAFPASFTLSLYEPPPAGALMDLPTLVGPDESRFGLAYIGALPAGVDAASTDDLVGVSEGYLVVYVESDSKPGTQTEEFFGGPVSAGYHLMTASEGTPERLAEREACFEAAESDGMLEDDEIIACGPKKDLVRPQPSGFGANVTVKIAPYDDRYTPDWG